MQCVIFFFYIKLCTWLSPRCMTSNKFFKIKIVMLFLLFIECFWLKNLKINFTSDYNVFDIVKSNFLFVFHIPTNENLSNKSLLKNRANFLFRFVEETILYERNLLIICNILNILFVYSWECLCIYDYVELTNLYECNYLKVKYLIFLSLHLNNYHHY